MEDDREQPRKEIGGDDNNKKTFQLNGLVRLIRSDEIAKFEKIYFAKFPSKRAKYDDGKYLIFTFTPTWWRFTDWTHPNGKQVLLSA